MPIEFWWWIKPLILTGTLFMFILTPIAVYVERNCNRPKLMNLLLTLMFGPVVVGILSIFGWFISNLLILIWRR